MSLRDIVNVQITRETQTVSRAGFGTALILAIHQAFTERYREYDSMSAVSDDFDSASDVYKAAQAAFSQSPSPKKIAVGRRHCSSTPATISTAVDNANYTVTINGVVFTYNAGAGATVSTIRAGVVAAINAGSEPVTATNGSVGAFTVDADVSSVPYSLTVGDRITIGTLVADDDIEDDLDAIEAVNGTWYGLVITSRVKQVILDVAAWIEATRKIFVAVSDEADIIGLSDSGDTTSVAALLKAAAYARTALLYHHKATTEYADAAWIEKMLPQTPGSYTAMFKTLAGITVSDLTPTQSTNARAKFCNVYEEIGGVNITREGKVSANEFIDVIIFVDWLQARITESVYGMLVRSLKVPYTEGGIQAVASKVAAPLQEGQDNGGISPFEFDDQDIQIGGYVVTAPRLQDCSVADKAARLLTNVKFTAWLAGAIQAVEINGIVTV